MTNTQHKDSFDWKNTLIGVCLLLCAVSLIFIAMALSPVAKWANYQTKCVEQEIEKAPIAWAVRKCNGRSKVYQVKEPQKN